ncbi:hypothetical protein Q7P37_007982 [Cladosporium fusiforme]
MKHHNMLPYRPLAYFLAALAIAPASAQWGGQSQEYCSNQNTGSDYSPNTDRYNSFQACSENCGSDYAFAVVQWQSCWCSDYIPADQGDTSDCNQDCPGYPDNKCGNEDSGLYGYIALGKTPSGTAGGGSSSQASSTSAAASTSERVSTSTASTSSRRERTSSSPTFSSSTTPVASSSTSSDSTSDRTSSLTPSSQQTSSSRRQSTSSSDPPTTSSSSRVRPTSSSISSSSSSSSPTPTTSSSVLEEVVPTSQTSIPESATPSPVTSTRVVTISGEPVTQTVTSTPMVAPDLSSQTDSSSNSKSTISGGAIAGIVIGVLAFLALLALVIFLLWRRKRQDPKDKPHGYPEMTAQGTTRRPRRNVSVLSKVGLLARHHDPAEDDNATNEASSAGPGGHSARHSALFPTGSAHGPEPASPLGPQSQHSNSLYQTDSRRHSKPLVYDQRLNPSALFANADANGSRVSMADNTDYSRPLDGLGGRLQVRNPDPRASFESRA